MYKLEGGGQVSYHKTFTSVMDTLLDEEGVSDKIMAEARFNEVNTNDEEELYDWLWMWGKEVAQEFGYSISQVEKEEE
jgi:hypothetical protein